MTEGGLGYGALNAARCALSTILPSFGAQSFGNHPLVCWLVKGGYERNPPKPRYSQFWDVNIVFALLKKWGLNSALSLKLLSFKLVMLLLLVSSQRGKTIINLSVDGMEVDENIVFKMKVLLKHNRVGDPLDTLVLRPFQECKRLCVVRTLKRYLAVTETFRGHSQLLLSFARPHSPISRDTLSRWTLQVMKLAGIDTSKYKGHSTRGASTSAARRLAVPINLIMKQASWKSATSLLVSMTNSWTQTIQRCPRHCYEMVRINVSVHALDVLIKKNLEIKELSFRRKKKMPLEFTTS